MPTKLILQYFGPKEVAVTSDGLLGALSRPSMTETGPKKAGSGKIAHSCIFRSPQRVSAGFYGRFPQVSTALSCSGCEGRAGSKA